MKQLKIDMIELEGAYTMDQMSEMENYLDTETGRVVLITSDDTSAVEKFIETCLAEDEDANLDAEFEKWLENYGCPDWQIEGIRDAYKIEIDNVNRYLWIEKQEFCEGYNDMVDFTECVADKSLQRLLDVALNGKGAFRRFKDVLLDYPEERERWFEFSNQRVRERLLEWLKDKEIEVEGEKSKIG